MDSEVLAVIDETAEHLRANARLLRDEWETVHTLWRDAQAREFDGLAVRPLGDGLDEVAAAANEFAAAIRAAWNSRRG